MVIFRAAKRLACRSSNDDRVATSIRACRRVHLIRYAWSVALPEADFDDDPRLSGDAATDDPPQGLRHLRKGDGVCQQARWTGSVPSLPAAIPRVAGQSAAGWTESIPASVTPTEDERVHGRRQVSRANYRRKPLHRSIIRPTASYQTAELHFRYMFQTYGKVDFFRITPACRAAHPGGRLRASAGGSARH